MSERWGTVVRTENRAGGAACAVTTIADAKTTGDRAMLRLMPVSKVVATLLPNRA
jgi:hypothetical protein